MEAKDERPQRYYTTRGLGIGEHTITQQQYNDIMKNATRPYGDSGRKKHDTRVSAVS